MSRFSLHRTEDEILDGVSELLTLVQSTVTTFFELVNAVGADDRAGGESLLKGVMDGEDRVASLRRELSQKIAEGAFFGGIREDILNLFEAIHSIADSAKNAARLLAIGRLNHPYGLTILKSGNMTAFLKALNDSLVALAQLIEALRIDRKTALSQVHNVETFEELGDTQKNMLLREVFNLAPQMDPITVIQLRDFLFATDDIADNAENASDVVMILIAKGYA